MPPTARFLRARQGVQMPQGLPGEPPLLSRESRTEAGVEEQIGVGLRAKLVQVYEERYEINSRF